MKIVTILLIMILFFLIGKCYKQKIINEYLFLLYLERFCVFLKSNLNLFKVNLIKVIDDFINLEEEKNAKFNNIFVKNNEIYRINGDYLKIINSNEQDNSIINSFLSKMGENEYEYENNKITTFINYLNDRKTIYKEKIENNGELTLKLLLAIGCVISILVW